MYIQKKLKFLIVCLLCTIHYSVVNAQTNNEAEKTFSYIACGTFEYNGEKNFQMQNAGIINILKKNTDNGNFSYTFFSNTNITVGDQQAAAEAKSPPLVVLRDPENKRLTGGLKCLKNFGLVGNTALAQVKHPIIADGRIRRFKLSMNTTVYYPAQPTYNISYKKLNSKTLGKCILVTATSDFFTCSVPDSNRYMSGVFSVVMICDPTLETMYYRASGFEARLGSEQINIKDNYWITLDGEAPARIDDIRPQLNQALASIYLPGKVKSVSNTTVPPWSVHALAVRKYMNVTAGAVIEGKPNFVVIGTVASVLLLDSGVSLASEILTFTVKKTLGKNIPVYKGIPYYIGQAGGWGAASIFSKITGKKANVTKWRNIGGNISDIAFLFVNPDKLGVHITGKIGKISKWGFKFIKDSPKTLKFGKFALSWETANIISMGFKSTTIFSKINNVYSSWFGKGNISGNYQAASQSSLINSKYGPHPPGGLTFEGNLAPLKITSAKYNPTTNSIILNNKIIYHVPISREELRSIATAITRDSRFGFSLSGKINGGYDKPGGIYENMKNCDLFIGNIIYGRADRFPHGCNIVDNYTLVKTPNLPDEKFCVNFNFIYKFQQNNNQLFCKSTEMQINMIPAIENKKSPGTWLFSSHHATVPDAFRQNASHLIDKLDDYTSNQIIKHVFNYGEVAAVLRTIKAKSINLSKLLQPFNNQEAYE